MRILVDMNLSPLWIPFLQQQGFEATHWSSVGAASATDADIMDHARAHGFVIFTHDLDFGMLLAMRGSDGPSVVQIRTQDVLPAVVESLVVNAVNDARVHSHPDDYSEYSACGLLYLLTDVPLGRIQMSAERGRSAQSSLRLCTGSERSTSYEPARRWPTCQNVLGQPMTKGVLNLQKERAAEEVLNAKAEFEMALSNKRKYPVSEFLLFVRAARRYIGLTAGDPLIHRKVAGEISGLSDYLQSERKRVPGDLLYEVDRLHCLLFSGYDPYFNGDEPPDV